MEGSSQNNYCNERNEIYTYQRKKEKKREEKKQYDKKTPIAEEKETN
jgi:hypothetical protein